MPASTTLSLIQQLEAGQLLSRANAEAVMEELLSGRMETDEIVRFLRALNARPVLVSELSGFASVMRRHAACVFADGEPRPERMIDTCGTGGGGRACGEARQPRGEFPQRVGRRAGSTRCARGSSLPPRRGSHS